MHSKPTYTVGTQNYIRNYKILQQQQSLLLLLLYVGGGCRLYSIALGAGDESTAPIPPAAILARRGAKCCMGWTQFVISHCCLKAIILDTCRRCPPIIIESDSKRLCWTALISKKELLLSPHILSSWKMKYSSIAVIYNQLAMECRNLPLGPC